MTKPQRMEVRRRISRLTYQESGATKRMIRKGLRLITHSWAIWGPRDRFRESMNCGRCRASEALSTQSTMKLGSMSQSCMSTAQKTEAIRMKTSSRGLTRCRAVVDHHLPDPGGAVGPGIHLPVGEQPQQVQTDQDGAAVKDHGPGVAVEEMGQRRPQKAADVDHHVEKTPAHPGGLLRQGPDKGALDGRLEDRGARGQ